MEALFSAALGELASRCLSFLINKYSETQSLSKAQSLRQLERALLRVSIVVEEADRRYVTNQAMLRQLNVMRQGMYRGYYILDKVRHLDLEEGKSNNHQVSCSLGPSTSNPGKLCPFFPSRTHCKKELGQIFDCLQSVIADMNEFVEFLKNYPPMCRQPYSMYLLLENCLFGRQAEMERTVYFLLQREPPGEHNLGILPIIGQGKVGKTTFVEHVCLDERVRDHFSQIVFFRGNKFRGEKLSTLGEGGIIKHQNSAQNIEKMLIVVELDGDIDGDTLRSLLSSSRSRIPSGSKIIITSSSEKTTAFGTTQALRLEFLPREACWYFFRVLVFGSTNPEEQPKLASIAMEIFEEYFRQDLFRGFTGTFTNSYNIAGFLRANVSTQHWRRILACVRGNMQDNLLPMITGSGDTSVENRHFYLRRIANISQYCIVGSQNREEFAHERAAKITLDEVMSGSVTPKGKFEVVTWRSHLPPYYSYITSCEIRDAKDMKQRNKCCQKRKNFRNIMEGVMILRETIHEIHRKKLDGAIFKIDFEKLCDKVQIFFNKHYI